MLLSEPCRGCGKERGRRIRIHRQSQAGFGDTAFDLVTKTIVRSALPVTCRVGEGLVAQSVEAELEAEHRPQSLGIKALGVDLSAPMLNHARRAAGAEGLTNVSFLQADAQIHPFEPASFDVAICRTSAMFLADHAAALVNIGRALRPGGRLVLLTWQPRAGNEWLTEIATALAAGRPPQIPPPGVGPFALSEPGRIHGVLDEAGFTDVKVAGNDAPMWFGTDAPEACQFILGLMGWMLDGLDDGARAVARHALEAVTSDHETPDGVTFASATWITTARVG